MAHYWRKLFAEPTNSEQLLLSESNSLVNHARKVHADGDLLEAKKALSMSIQLMDYIIENFNMSKKEQRQLMRQNLNNLREFKIITHKIEEFGVQQGKSDGVRRNEIPVVPVPKFADQDTSLAFQKFKHTIVNKPGDLYDWDKIIGQEEAKSFILNSIINPLIFKKNLTSYDFSTGILMYGPPGTGKSMIARSVASKMKLPFMELTGAELISKWQGESEQNIATFFKFARSMAPCIVFIDEIDSLFGMRSSDSETPEGRRGISNQLLRELQGAPGVFLIGATNTPWQIDPAFVRRFDCKCYVGLPNFEERKKLLTMHLEAFPNTVLKRDVEEFARVLEGYSPSDIFTFMKAAVSRRFAKTREAQYFSQSMDGKWFPVRSTFPNAKKMNFKDIPTQADLIMPYISLMDLELSMVPKTSTPESLEKYIEFKQKLAMSK